MLNSIEFSLPDELTHAFQNEAAAWDNNNKIARIWKKDPTVWANEDEAKWLGWLTIVDEELENAAAYKALTADIEAGDFDDVLLMGMGGSSLCPEVLSMTFQKKRFHILDSTVPAQIRTVEDRIDVERTIFIVASKSGSTLEPNCFKQYFFEKVAERIGREKAGGRFIAITDPGSKMEQVARDDNFRHIFHGKPEIGGRFSALSAFGLTAAASMGLDVGSLLTRAADMVTECGTPRVHDNPGALLGLVLGICQRNKRDKITIFTSPEIHDLGAWLEQLIAESTGKKGIAIIPVDREPEMSPDDYSSDRVFAFLSVKGGDGFGETPKALQTAGHPVVEIELTGIDAISQEFFRWEFATAVAGSIMEINPFNQPDVEAAKIEARKLTDEYEKTGSLPAEEPFFTGSGSQLFSGDDYAGKLSAAGGSLKELLDAHLANTVEGDYFAILAYIEMNAEHEKTLTEIRKKVLERTGVATCLGFGPRFLHSTGQAYKGGGNNGVVLQITSDDADDLAVPGQKYTFGVVKSAQARGDFQVLLERGRRALRVHLGPDVTASLNALAELF